MRWAYAVNDEAHEFFVTSGALARPGPRSPATEYRAHTWTAGEAAEILRPEAAEYADLARRLEDLTGDEE
jgi:hypothetical protein